MGLRPLQAARGHSRVPQIPAKNPLKHRQTRGSSCKKNTVGFQLEPFICEETVLTTTLPCCLIIYITLVFIDSVYKSLSLSCLSTLHHKPNLPLTNISTQCCSIYQSHIPCRLWLLHYTCLGNNNENGKNTILSQ